MNFGFKGLNDEICGREILNISKLKRRTEGKNTADISCSKYGRCKILKMKGLRKISKDAGRSVIKVRGPNRSRGLNYEERDENLTIPACYHPSFHGDIFGSVQS
jgi:hypothetical protein